MKKKFLYFSEITTQVKQYMTSSTSTDALLSELNDGLIAFAPTLDSLAFEHESALNKVAKSKEALRSSPSASSTLAFKTSAVEAKKLESRIIDTLTKASEATGLSKSKIMHRFKLHLSSVHEEQMFQLLKAQQTLSLLFVVDATGTNNNATSFFFL